MRRLMAERPLTRRDSARRGNGGAARSVMYRKAGAHDPSVQARSKKRHQDGAHAEGVAARSQKRRKDGSREKG